MDRRRCARAPKTRLLARPQDLRGTARLRSDVGAPRAAPVFLIYWRRRKRSTGGVRNHLLFRLLFGLAQIVISNRSGLSSEVNSQWHTHGNRQIVGVDSRNEI